MTRKGRFVPTQISSGTDREAGKTIFNVPNQLTALRLLLSIVLFFLVSWQFYLAAFFLFILAVSTDWIDGYWARKFDQITQVGRVIDPFVDKIIICGAFIFLVADKNSGIAAWMAVVVVGRELLVTAIRGHLEQQGTDFSAKFSGKLKMVLQSVAVSASLLVLGIGPDTAPAWTTWTRDIFIWLAIFSTIHSGADYVIRAVRFLRN